MPRTPKVTSSPTREKLARASKDRPKQESPTKLRSRSASPKKSPKSSPRKTSPKKTPTKKTPTKKTPTKEKSSPKKVKTPTSESRKGYSHPTYEDMIRRAIKEDASRKGTSYQAIYKFVESNFQVPANYSTHVRINLKKLTESGTLIHGATPARYKLSPMAKQEDKKAASKKTPKKEAPTPKKKSKSSKSSKSEESPKKKKTTPRKSSKSKEESSTDSPRKKASPKKKKESSKRLSSAVKEKTPRKSKEVSTPTRGGIKKPEKKQTTPRGSAKKASPLSSPSRDTSSAGDGKLKWVWQYYDNGFYNYNPTASDVVEGVYQEYLSSPYTTDVRSVKSGQWAYLVDFREMTQQNVEHENHTKRKIRRVQIPVTEVNDTKRKYADDADSSSSD